MKTYGVYELVKKIKKEEEERGRLRFSLGIEEALRKTLTHQSSYPILLRQCMMSPNLIRAVKIV